MDEKNILDPSLPLPDNDAREHSARVTGHVSAHIREFDNLLPFDRYMDQVLYAPGLGYYCNSSQKFGKLGDFVTAPEISALFCKCLARQIAEVLQILGHGSVLEVGPGTGALAAGLLNELEILGYLPDKYALLEVSPTLRKCQERFLESNLNSQLVEYHWLEDLPQDWAGVVLLNEVIDAMPVTRFQVKSGVPVVLGVQEIASEFGISWIDANEATSAIKIVDKYGLPEGYTSEISDRANAWVKEMGSRLGRGLLLIIDYGYTENEYYHRDRVTGTLMCHYQHRAHTNPFFYPGLQDITAHANFSSLAAAGHSVGMSLAGFTSQEAFLLSLGLTEIAEKNADVRSRAKVSHEIQKLTAPLGMGGMFKVLGLSKNLDELLTGFDLRDRSETL